MARLQETWGERVSSMEEIAALLEDERAGDMA